MNMRRSHDDGKFDLEHINELRRIYANIELFKNFARYALLVEGELLIFVSFMKLPNLRIRDT